MREEAKRFIKQADADLERVGANMEDGGWYLAVFLAQQAVEKYFKALGIVKIRELVKTHDMVELGRRLDAPEEILSAARELNHDYVATRYPDAANGVPVEQYDERIASEHLEWAKKAIEWAKREIAQLSSQGG